MRSVNIHIRAVEPEDLEFLYQNENNKESWLWGGQNNLFSKEDLRKFIESSHIDITQTQQKRFVIATNRDSTNIGCIDVFDYDTINRRASIGLIIYDTQYRGLGYGYEAIELLKEFCFEQLSLYQLYSEIQEANTHSIKLFEKCGFKMCGLKQDWVLRANKWQSVRCYQNINQ